MILSFDPFLFIKFLCSFLIRTQWYMTWVMMMMWVELPLRQRVELKEACPLMSLNSIFVGNTNNLKLIASNPQVTFKQIYILSSVHTYTSMCVYKPSIDGFVKCKWRFQQYNTTLLFSQQNWKWFQFRSPSTQFFWRLSFSFFQFNC